MRWSERPCALAGPWTARVGGRHVVRTSKSVGGVWKGKGVTLKQHIASAPEIWVKRRFILLGAGQGRARRLWSRPESQSNSFHEVSGDWRIAAGVLRYAKWTRAPCSGYPASAHLTSGLLFLWMHALSAIPSVDSGIASRDLSNGFSNASPIPLNLSSCVMAVTTFSAVLP